MKRIALILFWSVIVAAFIGPGTVTTCASAGSRFGLTLLWALLFSAAACFVLQEAAARVTVVSGTTLAGAIRGRWFATLLVLGAILVGCAAYEAGNVLGAVAGIRLAIDVGPAAPAVLTTLVAAVVLGSASAGAVARGMGMVVAVMAVAFLATAVQLRPAPSEWLSGALVPRSPQGSGVVVLALVGTTVVPYNLFLGSGLARGQKLRDIRFGLGVSIALGAAVSMAIVVAGTSIDGPFSFAAMQHALGSRLGSWAATLFAVGLFAAGFSSAVTAPLAAAITARGLFSRDDDPAWGDRGPRFRAVWGVVLATGLGFGLTGVRPVPVILAVQALNGILLPVVAALLIVVVNDRRLLGDAGINRLPGNAAIGATAVVAAVLGVRGVLGAVSGATGSAPPTEGTLLAIATGVAAVAAVPVVRAARRVRT